MTRRLQPAGEEGIALVMALLAMAVSSAVLVSVVQFTGSSGRDARSNHARQASYGLAEAGVNYAVSVLAQSSNPTLSTILPPTTVNMPGGTTTYSGVLSGNLWTLTGVGSVPNPSGPGLPPVRRTVTRVIAMNSISVGSFSGLWDRIYSDATGACSVTLNEGMNIPSKFAAKGDVCLNNASITGSSTTVDIGGNVTITAGSARLGIPSAASGWTNSTNVYTSNNVYATNAIAANANGANLDSTGFGFAIPDSATIDGISVEVERRASVSSTLKDASVYLLKAGVPLGTNQSGSAFWTTGDVKVTYGSESDLWGTTWTPAEVNASNFGLRFAARNHHASSASTASVDRITITVTYTDGGLGIGTSGTPIARAGIAGTCKWGGQAAHTPCTSADNVWSTPVPTTTPTNLTRPTINWEHWYNNAAPGPKNPCTVSTGSPPAFDNNGTYDGGNSDKEITPEGWGASYTCQVKNASGEITGELSWNAWARVLTIKGTIFFDGDAEFHDHDVPAWHYRGRGVIYIARDWHNDEVVCAGSATTNCRDTGMPAWDTNEDLMVLVIGGKNSPGNDFDFHRDSAFQGAIYATNTCKIKDTAYMQGPLNCAALDFDGDAPSFFPWPPLPNSADGQIYTTGTDSDVQLVLGTQTG